MYEDNYTSTITNWWPEVWKPLRPFAADNLARGTRKMARVEAMLRRHVEVNQRTMSNIIPIDVDHRDARLRLSYVDHPKPNLIAENPANGHAHGLWILDEPVTTTDAGRWKPLVYLSDVTEGIRRSVDGDPAYAGFLTKNPVHEHWETWLLRSKPYSLGELQSGLRANGWMPKFGWHRQVPIETLVGVGRNCSLFDTVRKWAYRAVRQFMDSRSTWDAAVFDLTAAANSRFSVPLPLSEAGSIARSVSKWVWREMGRKGPEAYDAAFIERQAARGRRSGRARAEAAQKRGEDALAMKETGMTCREIGEELGISERAVECLVFRARRSTPPRALTS